MSLTVGVMNIGLCPIPVAIGLTFMSITCLKISRFITHFGAITFQVYTKIATIKKAGLL